VVEGAEDEEDDEDDEDWKRTGVEVDSEVVAVVDDDAVVVDDSDAGGVDGVNDSVDNEGTFVSVDDVDEDVAVCCSVPLPS